MGVYRLRAHYQPGGLSWEGVVPEPPPPLLTSGLMTSSTQGRGEDDSMRIRSQKPSAGGTNAAVELDVVATSPETKRLGN